MLMKSPESSIPQTPIFPSPNVSPFKGGELTLQGKSPQTPIISMSPMSLNIPTPGRASPLFTPSQEHKYKFQGFSLNGDNNYKSSPTKQNCSFGFEASGSEQFEEGSSDRKINYNYNSISNFKIGLNPMITEKSRKQKIRAIPFKKFPISSNVIPEIILNQNGNRKIIQVTKNSTNPNKENRNLCVQMIKALNKTNKYKGNIYAIIKDFNLNDDFFHSSDFKEGLKNSSIMLSFRNESSFYIQNANLIKRKDEGYEKDYIYFDKEIDTKDESIKNLCFLTIPRIICRNGILQLMSICPVMNKSNKTNYFLYFKNVETFQTLEKLAVNLLVGCFKKSINSFGIQFLQKSSYSKVTYNIFTRFPEECQRYVEGFNFLLTNRFN